MTPEKAAGRPYVSVVVPAYNEIKQIAGTVEELRDYFRGRRYSHEIIVSADGDDGTRERVAELARTDPALKVIGGVERRGKGLGVRQGVRTAQGEIIGFVDADNKTPITEFDKVEPLLKSGNDVVIGSRRLRDSQIERVQPYYRHVGSKGFALLMHTVVGLRDIPDTQCGFKFFQRRTALDLFSRQVIDGYMFDVEILYLAQRAGYRIAQVPVRWRADPDSRLAVFSGNVRNVIDIFRIRFASPAPPEAATSSGRSSAQ